MKLTAFFLTFYMIAGVLGNSDGTLDEYREHIVYDTVLGATIRAKVLGSNIFDTTESCRLVDPLHTEYKNEEISSTYNIEIVDTQDSLSLLLYPCEYSIGPVTADMHGEWNLVAKMIKSDGQTFDIVQPFSVVIAGISSPDNDLPEGDIILEESEEESSEESESDEKYEDSTDDVVPENVNGPFLENITLINGDFVDIEFGPEDSDFCQILNPENVQMYRGYGRCKLVIEKATRLHEGMWTANIILHGNMLVTKYKFHVFINSNEQNPEVRTNVDTSKDSLYLSCSVNINMTYPYCKFISPDNQLILVKEGVEEDRYSHFGAVSRSTPGVHCGLQVAGPKEEDYGTWQCIIGSEERRLSSFLTVQGTINEAVDLIVSLEKSSIVTLVNNPVSMKCKVQTAIDYCWFRAPNGSSFFITQNTQTDNMKYYGDGLDFGECGITIYNSRAEDSGTWTCNVGLQNEVDRSGKIHLTVHKSPIVIRAGLRKFQFTHVLTITGSTYDNSPVNYCRYVNPSGIGFNGNITHGRYTTKSLLSSGVCTITVMNPSYNELSPWTIAAQLYSEDEETSTTVQLVRSNSTARAHWYFFLYWMTIITLVLLLFIIMLGGNKKVRSWTTQHANAASTAIRSSFRRRKEVTTSTEGAERASPPAYEA